MKVEEGCLLLIQHNRTNLNKKRKIHINSSSQSSVYTITQSSEKHAVHRKSTLAKMTFCARIRMDLKKKTTNNKKNPNQTSFS